MKTYTEKDLRKLAEFIDDAYRPYTSNNIEGSVVVEDFLEGLYSDRQDEEEITFSYSFLRRKLGWEEFCDLTGINRYAKAEGYEIKNTDTFQIKESKAVKFGLL